MNTQTLKYFLFKMSPHRRKLLMLAFIYSLWIEFKIFVFGNEFVLKGIMLNSPIPADALDQRSSVFQVKRAVSIVSRKAPWNPLCLNLALVGRKLLESQGIPSQFHLGWLPNQPKGKMLGHAWLTIHEVLITGYLPNLKDYVEMKTPQINQ